MGVDLNRNFDTNPNYTECEEYPGLHAFSELETRAIRDYIGTLHDVVFAYSIHSYAQAILCPYGHTKKRPQDYPDLVSTHSFVINFISVSEKLIYFSSFLFIFTEIM